MTPPPWIDDLFGFPCPPAFRALVNIAWEHAFDFYVENETFDVTVLDSRFDFMFDLTESPRPLDGWDRYPEVADGPRVPAVPLYAVPEFTAFGSLGTGGYVGWLVPAPELSRPDHPVVLADGHEPGVTLIGADTRAGLEFMLSWALRRWREDAEEPSWRAGDRRLLARLAADLGVAPDPDRAYPGSSWQGSFVRCDPDVVISFEAPGGWRHVPGSDGVGVLAPASAFADGDVETGVGDVLDTAERHLGAGRPASALWELKEAFTASPGCRFTALKPLWARAYRDLGRPGLAARLDAMDGVYSALPCFCAEGHG